MRLFSGTDTYSVKRTLIQRMTEEINSYDRDYILNGNTEQIVSYLVDKYGFELPRVDFNSKAIVAEGEAGRGSYVTVSFAFEGSKELLTVQPTTYLTEGPDVGLGDGELWIRYSENPESRSRIPQAIDRDIRRRAPA